jgi:hypothetical protein
MPNHICCSWGETALTGGTDLVIATGNDEIIFPHVDSCLAIIFTLPNQAIGGHAHMQPDIASFPDTEASLQAMLARMRRAAGGAKPLLAIFVGALSDSDPNLWPVRRIISQDPHMQGVATLVKNLSASLDVFFKCGSHRLIVQPYNGGKPRPPVLQGIPLIDEITFTAPGRTIVTQAAAGCVIM